MSPVVESLAPGLATLGAGLAILPWLRREGTVSRAFMAAIAVLLLVLYFRWRVTSSVPPVGWTLDFGVGLLFLVAEASALASGALALVFLSRTRNRTPEVEANLPWLSRQPEPLIDVFICTYNEEERILERTIIGATGMDYGNFRVWVLDDGGRPWLAALAKRLGCRYLARADHRHAKAGNINHGLAHVSALPDPPQFIAILDADFVPMPQFLRRTLALFRDESVGIVQTPQHFINPDPIQANLAAARVLPDEQRYFFDIFMPAKDAWGTAFCCGTSSLIRMEPLMRIGGFPTDSVTEDYLLTLRMKEIGAQTIYLNERLTIGLAPEGLKEYITQRSRWCLGFMQIVRGRSGPFSRQTRLGFVDRLSLIDAFLSWTALYSMKIFGLIVPLLYLLFGIRSVDAPLSDLLRHFLPYFFWQSLTMAWVSAGRSLPILADIAQFLAAPAVLRAIFAGLLKPKGQIFKVTAKGGDRGHRFFEWPVARFYLGMLVVTSAAILYAFVLQVSGARLSYSSLAFAWSWYNAVILILVCFVCVEQPRRRKAERFEANEAVQVACGGATHLYRLADISITGARIRGAPALPVGARVRCTLRGQSVEATIVRSLADGFAVKFDENIDTRIAMIRNFYAGDYITAFDRVGPTRVGWALFARLFR